MKLHMKCRGKSKQKGNLVVAILALVAVIGVISVWLMSGDTNTTSSSNSTADVMGSSIANDGGAIKATFDTLVINGASASSITFIPATAGSNNILDPTNGIQYPVSNPNAFTNTTFPNGAWIYNGTGFKGNGIGTSAVDQVALVAGVKDGVCQNINSRAHASTTIPASGLASSVFTSGAFAATPTGTGSPDLSAVAGVAGWVAGCVSTTNGTDNNVYFRVLKAN